MSKRMKKNDLHYQQNKQILNKNWLNGSYHSVTVLIIIEKNWIKTTVHYLYLFLNKNIEILFCNILKRQY